MKTAISKKTTLPKLLKKTEEEVNAAIRRRDSEDGYFNCISCGIDKPTSSMNAGHFVPVSKSSYLRFHPFNISGECEGCNCFNEYHLVTYQDNLIKKIGIENVDWLKQSRHIVKRWTRSELETIIDHARNDNLEAIIEEYKLK